MIFGNWAIGLDLVTELTTKILPDPNATILELGSGDGSTPFLANYYSKVYSVEENEKWVGKHDNVQYFHVPLKEHKPISHFIENKPIWYSADVLRPLIANLSYDLILVDGPSSQACRAGMFKYWDLFKNDVPVIFDDFQRGREQALVYRLSNKLQRRYTVYPSKEGKPWALLHP